MKAITKKFLRWLDSPKPYRLYKCICLVITVIAMAVGLVMFFLDIPFPVIENEIISFIILIFSFNLLTIDTLTLISWAGYTEW